MFSVSGYLFALCSAMFLVANTVVGLVLFVFNTKAQTSGISAYLSVGFKEAFLSLF